MLDLYVSDDVFLLTNCNSILSAPSGYIKIDRASWLYGYAFLDDSVLKNENLCEERFDYICNNLVQSSGIFCALKFENGEATLALDPLCQYNIFYKNESGSVFISNSIDCIGAFCGSKRVNGNYVYDQLAYQSVLRSGTILDEVYYLKFDDIAETSLSSGGWEEVDSTLGLTVIKPEYSFYDGLSYEELLGIYIKRLNRRALILSELYDEVHVQLTGGADSRLATSSFLPFSNIYCYVYGDGSNQNRLVFEHIVDALSLHRASPVIFVGQPLTNSSRVFRGLFNTNYFKLNNLNTYMNGLPKTDKKVCKVTGYYGANVSGGVVLPPKDTHANRRLKEIPPALFTYHEYVDNFWQTNRKLRRAAFNDLFYINNRGKSHYAAHSIADNFSIDSFDILYDYLNLLMVRACPYSDNDVDKNAISVDLIYINNPQLSMFPYDGRRIPKFRDFENVPLINCFMGYEFPSREINPLEMVRPTVDDELSISRFDGKCLSLSECAEHPFVKNLASKYPNLEYLLSRSDAQAGIFLQFLLSCAYLGLNRHFD